MNTTRKSKPETVTVRLSQLAGKQIAGIRAQVRNPRYISQQHPPMWRTLKCLTIATENKQQWFTLFWEKQPHDACNFTGCTVAADSCTIQMFTQDYEAIAQQKTVNRKPETVKANRLV